MREWCSSRKRYEYNTGKKNLVLRPFAIRVLMDK